MRVVIRRVGNAKQVALEHRGQTVRVCEGASRPYDHLLASCEDLHISWASVNCMVKKGDAVERLLTSKARARARRCVPRAVCGRDKALRRYSEHPTASRRPAHS